MENLKVISLTLLLERVTTFALGLCHLDTLGAIFLFPATHRRQEEHNKTIYDFLSVRKIGKRFISSSAKQHWFFPTSFSSWLTVDQCLRFDVLLYESLTQALRIRCRVLTKSSNAHAPPAKRFFKIRPRLAPSFTPFQSFTREIMGRLACSENQTLSLRLHHMGNSRNHSKLHIREGARKMLLIHC